MFDKNTLSQYNAHVFVDLKVKYYLFQIDLLIFFTKTAL